MNIMYQTSVNMIQICKSLNRNNDQPSKTSFWNRIQQVRYLDSLFVTLKLWWHFPQK